MLFAKKNGVAMPGSSVPPLEIEDEVQHRLEGVFASAAERYASDLAEEQDDEGGSILSGSVEVADGRCRRCRAC